jgi:hypothetical protein
MLLRYEEAEVGRNSRGPHKREKSWEILNFGWKKSITILLERFYASLTRPFHTSDVKVKTRK